MNDNFRSQFRLPFELADKLREAADSSGRSMNAEVVARLQSSFANGSPVGGDERLHRLFAASTGLQHLLAMVIRDMLKHVEPDHLSDELYRTAEDLAKGVIDGDESALRRALAVIATQEGR